MSTPEDGKLYQSEHHAALSVNDVELWLGLKPGEWARIKKDVERGSRRFWAKRGLPDPGASFFRGEISQQFKDSQARRAAAEAELSETTKDETYEDEAV